MNGGLALLLRRQTGVKFMNPLAMAVSRAPKKKDKKGGGSTNVSDVHDDVVNIFKDRQDPIILPSEYYPPWLLACLEKKYSFSEVVKQVGYGVRVPSGKEQWTFIHSLKRDRIRYRFDHDKVYDSDDESREGDDHDLDEFVAKQMEDEKEETGEVEGAPGQAASTDATAKDAKADAGAAAGGDAAKGGAAKGDAAKGDAAAGKGDAKGGAAAGKGDAGAAAKAPPKK